MHELVIVIAKYLIVVPVLLLAIIWLRLSSQLKKQSIVVGVLAAVFTVIFAIIGSKLFYDPRPFVVGHFTPYFAHGNDNGFPSDHTLLASLCAAITYMYSSRVGIAAFCAAVLIGISRIIAGVHHGIDIIGAMIFATAGTILAYTIIRKINKSH